MPLVSGIIRKKIHKGCVFFGGKYGMQTIKILKIIRDASSQPNHNIPYTKKMCVIGDIEMSGVSDIVIHMKFG